MSKNNSKNLINFSKSYIDYLSQVLNKINKKSISDLEKLSANKVLEKMILSL